MRALIGTRRARALVMTIALAVAAPAAAGAKPKPSATGAGEVRAPAVADLFREHRPAETVTIRPSTGEPGWAVEGPVRRPEDVLRSSDDPRTPDAIARATRALVESTWGVDLPDPSRLIRRARNASDGDNVIRVGLPGGDLDGDGLDDALSLEYSPSEEFFYAATAVRALRGTNGTQLWNLPLDEAYDAIPLAAGDLTGDGAEDVLVLALTIDSEVAQGTCVPVVACAVVADLSFHWDIIVVSGADGAPAWSRRLDGGVTDVFAFELLPTPTFNLVDAYTIRNAIALPQIGDDYDGDGAADVILNAFDVTGVFNFNEVFALVGGAFVFGDTFLIASKGEVATGSDGTALLTRSSSYAPASSFLYPAGDAVGNATGDIASETITIVQTPFACVFLLVGACAGTTQTTTDVEMIDGNGLATAWRAPVATAGSQFTVTYPAGADLTGDGRADLLVDDFGVELTSGVVSGADGSVPWRRADALFPLVIGDADGDDAADLLGVGVTYFADGFGVSLIRLAGPTGEDLFATDHLYLLGDDDYIEVYLYPIGDGDSDGTVDPVLEEFRFDFDTEQGSSAFVVESGATGASLLTLGPTSPVFGLPIGDLDGDGRDDLLTLVGAASTSGFDVTISPILVPSGTHPWSRTDSFEPFFDLLILSTADQVGDGGGDAVYSRIQDEDGVLASRIDGLDGRTGGAPWGHGPPLRPPTPKGAIAGTVTNADGAPIYGVCVDVFDDFSYYGFYFTGSAGTFTIGLLPAGSFYVSFSDCWDGIYAGEYYDDATDFADADPVPVVPGSVTSGIDAVLAPFGP